MVNNALYVMRTEESDKKAVLAGLHAGWSPKATAEFNTLLQSSVYQMRRALEMSAHPVDMDT